jgi:hypothetical protein
LAVNSYPAVIKAGSFVEKGYLKVLKADIKAQVSLIRTIAIKINERAEGLSPDDPIRMESVAY